MDRPGREWADGALDVLEAGEAVRFGPDSRVLELAMPDGGSIFPLDAGLRWIDLSPAEREAALRARPA